MWSYNYEYGNYLCHWGIKGMKWGVRRYQNSDGTLTPAGKKRYQNSDGTYNDKAEKSKNIRTGAGIKNALARLSGREAGDVDNFDEGMFWDDSDWVFDEVVSIGDIRTARNSGNVKKMAKELEKFIDDQIDEAKQIEDDDTDFEPDVSSERYRAYKNTYMKDPEAYVSALIDSVEDSAGSIIEWKKGNGMRHGDELQHHGIKGQKWGVRRYQNKNGSLTAEGKKRYRLSAQDVKDGKAEADERIRYYGGKNAAVNAIKNEAARQKGDVFVKGVLAAELSTLLGGGLGGLAVVAGAPVAVPALLVASGAMGATAAQVWSSLANVAINKHKKEQLAYTQDSEAGADYVVTGKKDK